MIEQYFYKGLDGDTARPFKCDGYMPETRLVGSRDQSVGLETLPPILRTLLVTDGTVTKVLEAYFWEPVVVESVALNRIRCEQPLPWLALSEGAEVLVRQVFLVGKHSGTRYASAFSVVNLQVLPDDLQAGLVSGALGIGVLIRDTGMESYREILELGLDEHGLNQQEGVSIYRTYRILTHGKPAILITESFPLSVYAGSSGCDD